MIGLLIGLLFCHYLADFTHLSLPYMLKAKSIGAPTEPIFHHALVHGILMAALMLAFCGAAAATIVFGIIVPTHFAIDVLKGKLNVWYPALANSANPWHWYVFGADQFLHILVIIATWIIIS